MEIICQNCGSKFNVPDEKVPEGKTTTFKCPKCKGRINAKRPESAKKGASAPTDDFFGFDENEDEDFSDSGDRPFDFVEDEGKTAMICEPDPEIRDQVRTVLEILEYHIVEPVDSRQALKKLRYQYFNLVVLNENYNTRNPDANGLLIFLERLDITMRRSIFVCLLSNRFRTMDNMAAFQKSVNIIVNTSNINDLDKILRRGLADYDLFYRVIKEFLP
ncbi:MAG: hypothetical protein HKM93_13990 [Desulfobacteraceae bacterium]|nr:hypothetical protein [Desulfobacteraceae bacterium]